MLRLQPDTVLANVRKALVEAHRALTEPIGAQSASEGFNLWMLWASNQVAALRWLIAPEDIDRLITTRLYWSLFGTNSNYLDQRALRTTVHDELLARQTALTEELRSFDNDVASWGNGGAVVVVPDTSVFIEKGYNFPDLEWHELLEIRASVKVYLVVAMAAVVELDGKKLSRENSGRGQLVRTQVRAALKRIEELFPSNGTRLEFNHTRGITSRLWTTLLTDSLGHVPLESADAEMIRRGLDLLPYAGKGMLVSYDLNQTFRARAAGLASTRLKYEYELERPPEPGPEPVATESVVEPLLTDD